MASFALSAELQKLARVLEVDTDRLDFLEALDVATIRKVREQISASLFDPDRHLFQRLAAASKMLPTPIAALISEKALGPLLCARVAGLLPATRAVDIAKRLHTGFLADVCLALDPRNVRELIAGMPVKRVVEVALELAERGEDITMAQFVDCLPEASMRAVLNALTDNALLLRIGFFVEDPVQLDSVILMLPEQRIKNLIVSAIEDGDELWAEALNLINGISEAQRLHMAGIAARLDDQLLTRMLECTQMQQLWSSLLPVVAAMDDTHRAHLAQLPALDDDTVLESLIRAADDGELWLSLLPLVEQMPARLQMRAATVAGRLGPPIVDRLTEALARFASPKF